MSKGKARVNYLGGAGLVQSETAPGFAFLYRVSTVRDAKWNIGDRVVLPDGRVFRYGKSSGALNVDFACSFTEDEAQGYTTIKTAAVVGATEIEITNNTHAEFTEDELRGGYVIIYHTGGGGDTQFRGIIGNPAAAQNADFKLTLDAPLDHAVIAGSTGVEVFYNPYANLSRPTGTGDVAYSKAGKPAVQVAAANTYFWVQTWGPCWIPPVGATFSDINDRAAYFTANGSIQGRICTVDESVVNDSTQYAGFLIGEGYSSGPLLMLQVCP